MKKVILKILILATLSTIITFANSYIALAHTDVVDHPVSDTAGIGRFMNPPYINNYRLDIRNPRRLDVISEPINGIANILFNFVIAVSRATIAIFRWAMGFDLASVLGDFIDTMQANLMGAVFDTLFIITFAFFGFQLIKRFVQRNFTSILVEVGQVVFIVVLSILLVTHTSTILTQATNITRSVGISIASGMNNTGGEVVDFAEASSIMIWDSLVHQLYIFLQTTGSGWSAETATVNAEELLEFLPGSASRNARIVFHTVGSGYPNSNRDVGPFNVSLGGRRIGFLLFYLIPFLMKSAIYLILSLIQIAFQAMSIFYVLLAPIVLVLSVTKLFGGVELLSVWLKKLLEAQILMLLLTILLSLIVRLDTALFSLAHSVGFFLIVIVQTGIFVFLFLWRDKIFGVFAASARVVHNPQQLSSTLANSRMLNSNSRRMEKRAEKREAKNAKKISSAIQNSAAQGGFSAAKENGLQNQKNNKNQPNNAGSNVNPANGEKIKANTAGTGKNESNPQNSNANNKDKNISADKVNINRAKLTKETAEEKAKTVDINSNAAEEERTNNRNSSSGGHSSGKHTQNKFIRPTANESLRMNKENKGVATSNEVDDVSKNNNRGANTAQNTENKERVRPSIIDISNYKNQQNLPKAVGDGSENTVYENASNSALNPQTTRQNLQQNNAKEQEQIQHNPMTSENHTTSIRSGNRPSTSQNSDTISTPTHSSPSVSIAADGGGNVREVVKETLNTSAANA
ncbi:MAG: hypothetical protein FWG63_04805, partial [Defluviitaleaceae bacterium]|nr:hypothetical protein [Defluviitaleaceae bacterium]